MVLLRTLARTGTVRIFVFRGASEGDPDRSLASVLAVHEIMYQGCLLSSTYYRPLEILTVVALVYFVLIYPGSYLSARLERRLAARD